MKTQNLINISLLAGVCSVAMGITSSAFGQTILIDFGMTSATVNGTAGTNLLTVSSGSNGPDTNGNYWTNFNGNSTPQNALPVNSNVALVSTTNATTGITMTYTGTTNLGTVNWNGGDPVLLSYVPLNLVTNPNFRIATAVQDIFYLNSGGAGTSTATFTLTGLDPSKTYKLEFYGVRPTSAIETRQALWTAIGGTSVSGNYFTSNTSFTGTNATPYYGNFNSLILSPIAPGGNNTITLNLQYGGGSASLNAMQITVIPEPAIWGLLAFSLTTVMVLRRRRE